MLLAVGVAAGVPLRSSLLSAIIECFILSVHPVLVFEGQASIFSVSGRGCAGPLPESKLECVASLSTVAEWTLLGAVVGFLSFAGSEAVT